MPDVLAILSVHDEARFIRPQLEHLASQGVETFVLCDRSPEPVLEVIESFRGRGVIGSRLYPPRDFYDWEGILREKQTIAASHAHDWILIGDVDEFRMSEKPGETLGETVARVDADGYNAINFAEYVFVPTREHPDHDHPDFLRSMQAYYAFMPHPQHRRTLFKKTGQAFEFVHTGGHRVDFAGLRVYPENLPMRHYLYLSLAHFEEKYHARIHSQRETERGWHGWRAAGTRARVSLPAEAELKMYDPGAPWDLDAAHPRTEHLVTVQSPPPGRWWNRWFETRNRAKG